MEVRLHLRLEIHGRHGLSDSICDCRHPEHPNSAPRLLRYFYRSQHPVPQLVEVPLEVHLECCDGFPVDARGSLVGLDPAVCLPYDLLRDRKLFRLRFALRLLLLRQLTAD